VINHRRGAQKAQLAFAFEFKGRLVYRLAS
jgi:hypothetical protein